MKCICRDDLFAGDCPRECLIRWSQEDECRLTYASRASRITCDSDSPRRAATAIASFQRASGTRTVRILPPSPIRLGRIVDPSPVGVVFDDPAIHRDYPHGPVVQRRLPHVDEWSTPHGSPQPARTPVVDRQPLVYTTGPTVGESSKDLDRLLTGVTP